MYILYYYAWFAGDLSNVFGAHGMIERKFLYAKGPSLFFVLPWDSVVWISLFALIALAGAFFAGWLNRWGLLALFALNLSFHHANPYIHGEPQALTSLFLFAFFFWPLKDGEEPDPFYSRALVAFLGFYYLIAGLKKLPDPLWLSGEAVGAFARWDGISSGTAISRWVGSTSAVGKIATYATILFELSFLPLLFTRFRTWLIAIGLAFHAAVACTLQVGTFSALMFVWYLLLVPADHATWRKFLTLGRKS